MFITNVYSKREIYHVMILWELTGSSTILRLKKKFMLNPQLNGSSVTLTSRTNGLETHKVPSKYTKNSFVHNTTLEL